VVDRRNGSLPVAIIADQANLSERVVREALDRAAAGGTRIVQVGGGYELKIDG
jgi:DNA-binding Lrp family transcriptional regulator